MKTILITGGNGFLGSNIAKSLIKDYNIILLVRKTDNLFRLTNILSELKIYSTLKDNIETIFQENSIDIIIHTATIYGRMNEPIKEIAEANLFTPFELLDKAIENGCKTFINTDTVLDRFVSAYALTKNHFREWLYLRRKEIKVINMQLEHFYGPGAPNTNFITFMINRLRNNEPVIDLTAGEQERDFIFIEDVIAAYQTVLNNQPLPNEFNEFQVSTQQIISIKELLKMLKELTGSTSVLNFGAIPYRENELMHSETDNSSLVNLGWKPKYSLIQGLQSTIISGNSN